MPGISTTTGTPSAINPRRDRQRAQDRRRGTRRLAFRRSRRGLVAVFDNARLAHDALRRLLSGEYDDELRRDYVEDTTEWYERMTTTPEFVLPVGWRGELRHEIARRAAAPASCGPIWSCSPSDATASSSPSSCGVPTPTMPAVSHPSPHAYSGASSRRRPRSPGREQAAR
ncbi:hypothetical protein [Streptomyces sp. MBT62]|uniref:hypothetical protein n=1 Tax=Streptomyces sp. MBT62 TaxID=2800410 RepID=UPI00190D0BAD|nr:hypothetical protein [Streptomyces sp. MBT62]MBK3563093.1 hypothetical protein [Streptomyces sp. MBT62]